MMIVNPPWTLEKELKVILPALIERLGALERAAIVWIGSRPQRKRTAKNRANNCAKKTLFMFPLVS